MNVNIPGISRDYRGKLTQILQEWFEQSKELRKLQKES
jgi:hypothetical protein